MKEGRGRTLLLLIPATLGFGSYEVVCKTMAMDPFQLTFMRFVIGGVVLLPFALRELKGRGIKLSGRELLTLVLLGALNVCISMNLMQVAMMYMPAYLAAMIFSTNPLFVAALSTIILKESFTVKKALALILGAAGSAIAILSVSGADSPAFVTGVLLQIASTIAFSVYTVLGKRISLRIGSMALTSITAIAGAVLCVPIVCIAGQTPFVFDWSVNWWQIIYLGAGITGLAYLLYFKALERMDTSLGSMSFFMKPVISVILSMIFLGETVRWTYIPGLVLVLAGILILGRATGRRSLTNGKTNI